jgi:hypothetical protein
MILFCHYDKIFAGPNKPSLYARWLYWLIDNHKVRYLHLVTSDSKAPEVFIANNLSCSNFAWQLRQQIDVTT